MEAQGWRLALQCGVSSRIRGSHCSVPLANWFLMGKGIKCILSQLELEILEIPERKNLSKHYLEETSSDDHALYHCY